MRLTKLIYVFLWIAGVCIVLTGIAVEFATGSDVGFILITAGSVVVAGGSIVFAKSVRGSRERYFLCLPAEKMPNVGRLG